MKKKDTYLYLRVVQVFLEVSEFKAYLNINIANNQTYSMLIFQTTLNTRRHFRCHTPRKCNLIQH